MKTSNVRKRWETGETAVCAWSSIGNSYVAEVLGWSGVDCVLVDLQHGMTDVGTMIGALQAISSTPASPFVRVPSCDPPTLMKVLDAGAYGVICPMINSAEEASAFVDATRYPPEGSRSFGPARGLLYGGPDYFEHANATIVRLAMIETASGLEAVDAICQVDGLDGIFIGPSDLGLAFGKGSSGDPSDPQIVEAIRHCLATARRHGKHAGIFCPSGKVAARRRDEGFDFVVPGSDVNLLKAAMASEVKETLAR
ncbi:MAG: 2,4-dihydroxyhept-2-ene-1,7-dioic acid aldolase [Rhizobiaceae bacterium]|nr:2,4-dihydroxyhept-2-ene-1,7-dioic acid aldolase [Rhizobiaceae bacterium]